MLPGAKHSKNMFFNYAILKPSACMLLKMQFLQYGFDTNAGSQAIIQPQCWYVYTYFNFMIPPEHIKKQSCFS